MLTKNKKGNFVAWFFVIVAIMAFAIFFLILKNAWNAAGPELAAGFDSKIPANSNVNVTEILVDDVGGTTTNFSNMIPFLIIGLFAFVMITAGAIIKHPIMIFVGIIVLGVLVLIAVVFSNVYTQISDSNGFSEADSQLGLQGKFMDYLPYIVVLLAIGVVAAILYGRSQGGGGQL